jgi:hypothetical protein
MGEGSSPRSQSKEEWARNHRQVFTDDADTLDYFATEIFECDDKPLYNIASSNCDCILAIKQAMQIVACWNCDLVGMFGNS